MARAFVVAKTVQSMGTAWFFAVYVLFLQSIGLSLLEANLLNLVYMSVSTVLDPFTGNIGDRIGQKRIYLIGAVFWGIGTFVYGFASQFWMGAIAESLSAIGHASMSEALESWLRNRADEKTTHEALASAQMWGKIAMVPTALLGGIIGAQWGLRWPWFLGGITCFAGVIIVWWLLRKWPEMKVPKEERQGVLNLWQITKDSWRDPVLKRAFIACAVLVACFQPFNMFWQPLFAAASGQSQWLGSMWIGIALTGIVGSWLVKRWKISSKGIALIVLSIGVPMLLPQFPGNWVVIMLIPFLLHEVGRSMWTTVLFSYTNRRIKDQVRASVNSLRSAAGSLGAAGGLVTFGLLTQWLAIPTIWGISAIALILISLWIGRWNHDC